MKINFKFLLVTTLLCFTCIFSKANDLQTFFVNVVDENTYSISMNGSKHTQIQITLKDERGVIMHHEILDKGLMIRRNYDIRNLPIGEYILVASYDSVVKFQPIKKGYNLLEIENTELQTIFKPSFLQHSEYVDLNMLCNFKGNVSLKIQDNQGHNIYKELIQDSGPLQRRFNLSELEKDIYTISVIVRLYGIYEEFNENVFWSPSIIAYNE